jgi:tRNA threonylcarbamoyladenosine biosynthesis protein TsaB
LDPVHPRVIGPHSFQAWLQDNLILFFGEGSEKCKPLLGRHSHALFIDHIYPQAHHIGTLAFIKFQQAIFEDLAYFTPLYLKTFQEKMVEEA